MSGASSLSSLKARSQTTVRRQPRDVYPDFEVKIQQQPTRDNRAWVLQRFALQDGLAFMTLAAQAIAQDEFSKCFRQEPRNSFYKTLALGPGYLLGILLRYGILFPMRLILLLSASLIFFASLPLILYLDIETWQRFLFKMYCKAFLASWGARIRYHGKKPVLNTPHLFVSNHTSVIDYIVLSANDFPHATIAQKHGGVIGYFEESILTLNGSLMFNRNQKTDRSVINQKMKSHVYTPSKSPILIFPEGTCVNNEYTVLFHKGAFELGAVVCPVAIKYDKTWADAYWHSKAQTFTMHLLYLMTRWALVADVWFLQPRSIGEGQSPIDFANSVKAEISKRANLRNLSMDGYFKNFAPPEDKQVRLRENPQTRYGAVLANRMKNRAVPLRFGHKRHNSVVGGLELKSNSTNPASEAYLLHQLDWIHESDTEATGMRNRILVALEDDENTSNMIQTIADRKNNVVETWKKFTKMRVLDDHTQRRIENSSWRLWFKQRIELQRKKAEMELEQELQEELDDESGVHSTLMSLFSSSRPSSMSDLRRTRSAGSLFAFSNDPDDDL